LPSEGLAAVRCDRNSPELYVGYQLAPREFWSTEHLVVGGIRLNLLALQR
jgi:hypothetical protein